MSVSYTHLDVYKRQVNAFVPGAIATALGLALMGVFYYLRERQR